MSLTVAIVGEEWEAGFARATARSFTRWLPADAEVCVAAELARTVADVCPRRLRISAATRPGFQEYAEVRRRVLRDADGGDGILLLAAGTLPIDDHPLERLGASWRQERVVEWHAPTEEAHPSVLRFQGPPHCPPNRPRHTVERVGALDVWNIDGGRSYFQALTELNGAGGPPVWSQYGARRPVFAYNTNGFSEPPIAAHDEYIILGSGLLGLRMIAESGPDTGARVLVYDINPDQLLWIRFLLEASGEVAELEEVVEEFQSRYPAVIVRPVLAHEAANAFRQAAWYRRNRRRLAEIRSMLSWEFLECDLWTDPATLLNRVLPVRRLFFMYLDLFVVWHIADESSWVEKHSEMAVSLEEAIRRRAKGFVSFLPGPHSEVFQLQPESPFALREG